MRRILGGVLLATLLASAQAEDLPPAAVSSMAPAADSPALKVAPERLGYAFERPEILVRQRLFGLAHGLSLLAASCLDLPEHSGPVQYAYAVWHARQAQTIEILALDLAAYYFGPRAAQAQWLDLARALNLKDSIQPSLGSVSLQDACASLPEAITRPRYELDRLLAEGAAPEPKATHAAAVASPRSGVQDLQTQATPGDAARGTPAPILQEPAE